MESHTLNIKTSDYSLLETVVEQLMINDVSIKVKQWLKHMFISQDDE